MKRILLCSLALLLALMTSAGIYAQQQSADFSTTRVIKGAVIDKNGNPLPGATVSATGGAETVTTDADGSYSIEVPYWLKTLTASYPGYSDKKLKLTGNPINIFTLKPYYRTYGFVNVMFANVWHVDQDHSMYVEPVQQLGVMGGAYRNWGGYAKVMMGIAGGGYEKYGDKMVSQEPTVTGGAIKRLNNNFNFFFGAGVGWNYGIDYYSYHNYYNEYYENWYSENGLTICAEAGIMAKLKKINFVLGLTYISPSLDYNNGNSGNIALFAGVGINI